MKNLEDARKAYDTITAPEELEKKLDEAFLQGRVKRRRRQIQKKIAQSCMCCFLLVCMSFVVLVNTNAVFAESISSVPILGSLAKVCTFVEYKEEDESAYIQVRIPEVKDTGNTELEKKINEQIREGMEKVLNEAKEEARLNWDAYLKTGGDPAEYVPMEVALDYEVKSNEEGRLSFVIWINRVRANYYRECTYYNYDLETGKEITLKDLLGSSWREQAYDSIISQMKEREKEEGESLYFRLDSGEYALTELPEHPDFYINDAGKPVIVFEKYEIGYGYIGEQEFEIPLSNA